MSEGDIYTDPDTGLVWGPHSGFWSCQKSKECDRLRIETSALRKALEEARLLVSEYDRNQSDWSFRLHVILGLIDTTLTPASILPSMPWQRQPMTEERVCQKCGEPTHNEEALVDGQIWCHPCADFHVEGVPCDWPQCSCMYDCERLDKAKEFWREHEPHSDDPR